MATNTNIYSGIQSPDKVGVFSSVTNTLIVDIPLASSPSTAATETPDGTLIYVGALAPTQDIYAISTASNTVTATISTAPHNVEDQACSNNAFAYFPLAGANLGIIDTGTNALTVLALGIGQVNFLAITPNGRFVYCPTVGSNQIVVVDTTTNTISTTIATGAHSNPTTVMTTGDGKWAYVGDQSLAQVYKIDTSTNTLSATITMPAAQTGGYIFSIDATSANVYAGAPSSGAVYVIGVASNTVTNTLPTTAPSHPAFGVTINNNKTYGYIDVDGTNEGFIPNAAPSTITSISLSPLHTGPGAVTPNGLALFVGDSASGNISVVSTATNTLLLSIADSGASTQWVLGQYFPAGPPTPTPTLTVPKLFIPRKGLGTYDESDFGIDWRHIELWANSWTSGLFIPGKPAGRVPTVSELNQNWLTLEVWADTVAKNTMTAGNIGASWTPLFIPRKNSDQPQDLDVNFLRIENWANSL